MTGNLAAELAGKVAIVTGGARGIGRGCALRLASLGAYVLVADTDLGGAARYGEKLTAPTVEEELRNVAGDAASVIADLSDPAAADAMVAAATERWGRLDILVSVAGGAVTPYETSSPSLLSNGDLQALLDANLWTTTNSCRAAVPAMRDSGGGSIITMGSVSGEKVVTAGGQLAGYGMIKAAIHHYTRYLATEVGKFGIRANAVAPGAVRTARVLTESAATGAIGSTTQKWVPLGRQGEVEDIADMVQYLATPISSYISGQVLVVNGGSTRL